MVKNIIMAKYNWQHPDWPNFTYEFSNIQDLIYKYVLEVGLLINKIAKLSDDNQTDTSIEIMATEALKSSEIEGERIDYEDIRSSIRKELGLASSHIIKDSRAYGISRLIVSLRQTFKDSLTEEQIFNWHNHLFSEPNQRNGITVGDWRKGAEPMQIISGFIGHEIIHFEAPPSENIPHEMKNFIRWFNESAKKSMPGIVRSALSHLYFESIHPFDDGNGRIGRAISEKALSQELQIPLPFSLSLTIQKNKKEYYEELSRASQYNLDITSWISYFAKVVYQAQQDTNEKINFIFEKAAFWKKYENLLNERQEKVISKMFGVGNSDFIGGMNAKKYMSITKCSKATATRDLIELLKIGCLIKLPGGGRSTSYLLNKCPN